MPDKTTHAPDPAQPLDDLGPRLAEELAKLTPRQRAAYEVWIAAQKLEWQRERLARAAVQDRLDASRAALDVSRANYREKLSEWREGLEIFGLIAAVSIGGAGLVGTCIGVLIALIRAGWRAGASL